MSYDIYAEKIILNYEHPHNKGILKGANTHFKEYNQVCGDEIEVYIIINNKKIKDVKFIGRGCAISMASASMITDFIKGKSIKEIEQYNGDIIKNILGIDPGPVRMKCATLSLRAIKEAIERYKIKK